MTERNRVVTESVIPLIDVSGPHKVADLVLAAFNWLLFMLLVVAAVGLSVFTVSPAALANTVTAHIGTLMFAQRLAFALGALTAGVGAVFLRPRLTNAWAWSRLPSEGALVVCRQGLKVQHGAVLERQLLIPWSNVRAITLDSGKHHDKALTWRRFPLPSAGHERSFLYATDGDPRPNFALIAGRPVAPNLAILFDKPMAMRNPNAKLVDIAFPSQVGVGMPAKPPAAHTTAAGLFLRTQNLARARRALLPTGKIRALRIDDLN